MKTRRKYVTVERTRHGKTVYYFRRPNGSRVRLPHEYESPQFVKAYYAALVNEPLPKPRPKRLVREDARKGDISRALKRAIKRAKSQSKRWPLHKCDLTMTWAIAAVEKQKFRCALSGIPFYAAHTSSSRVNPYAPSIDRIDCSIGYHKANCRVVIYAMNAMLMDWGHEVFERVANGYRYAKGTKTQFLSAPLFT